jgi:pimeloyl-ACP methyl ester carboxylesterase
VSQTLDDASRSHLQRREARIDIALTVCASPHRRWLERALLALVLTGVSACGGGEGDGDRDRAGGGQGGTGAASPLVRPEGSLSWRACGALECAEVEVPIDYDAPEAGTVPIALNRLRANAALPYRGVILINPGGPGVAGKPFVAASASALPLVLPGFDFVGFDPRGVGESGALDCALDLDIPGIYEEDGAEGLFVALEAASRACAERIGALFQHVGSNSVVADVDRIREALGHEELNFLGLSYGTRLGALYAMNYPEHARAVVLDAPLPPSPDIISIVEGQFEALLTAHAAFFAACAAGTLQCPADAEAVFERLLAAADEDGQHGQFVAGWALLLTTPAGRTRLAEIMLEVAGAGQQPGQPAPPPEQMTSELVPQVNIVTNLATNCADNSAAPLGVAEAEQLMATFAERSPQFASQGLAAINCSGWQLEPDPTPEIAFVPRVPPLVIGGTQDSLTPLPWARDIAAAISGSSLLVSEHYGHAATAWGGQCVFGFVRRYFEALEPAAADARCPAP